MKRASGLPLIAATYVMFMLVGCGYEVRGIRVINDPAEPVRGGGGAGGADLKIGLYAAFVRCGRVCGRGDAV